MSRQEKKYIHIRCPMLLAWTVSLAKSKCGGEKMKREIRIETLGLGELWYFSGCRY